MPIYALALAMLIAGLAAVGVALSTVLPALIVLACPLMMIFMMRGMHGDARALRQGGVDACPRGDDDDADEPDGRRRGW